jgi:uncharacterized membrane protein YbhN (UPF0104 family)
VSDVGQVAVPSTPGDSSLIPKVPHNRTRRQRMTRVAIWIGGLALFFLVLQLLGVDVSGWLSNLWDEMTSIPRSYTLPALVFQLAYTVLAGFSYYGILRVAYPGEVVFAPILTAYAVGVAMNGFLPANIGTFVTLVMFVAIIPSATLAGAIAAYLVQKIFFTLAGTFVFLYMFLSVPNSFNLNFSNLTAHPLFFVLLIAGIAVALVILARVFWRQIKKLWLQAKQGGVILSTPKKYMEWVFLPSFLAWCSKLIVTGIFLAAFAIPVTFESIMWVSGSGSLASMTSFTPGAIGVTQATNALALKTCCGVSQDVAVNYSTAQQLITTAWNVLFALILVVVVFGWTGGKQLVGTSYVQAKEKAVEMKEERKRKKADKKAAKQAASEQGHG